MLLPAEIESKSLIPALRAILAKKLAETDSVKKYIEDIYFPEQNLNTDDEILSFAKENGGTIFHPSCTCKMGNANDKLAVVVNNLNVHGIKGLRIVDASIMPSITSGNINAPTIMIAEKGANLITGI